MLIPFHYLFNKYKLKPTGVLHVGASEGQEATAYKKLGIPRAIFIEAIPAVYSQLEGYLGMHFPAYKAINACITDKDGEEVPFNISSNGGQSSSIYEFGTHKDCHPDVTFVDKINLTTKRLDTLFQEHNLNFEEFDFINFDIQGAELLALKGMGQYLNWTKCAYLEVNKKATYKGCALVTEVDDYMREFDMFRIETTQWVGDTWADAFYIKIQR